MLTTGYAQGSDRSSEHVIGTGLWPHRQVTSWRYISLRMNNLAMTLIGNALTDMGVPSKTHNSAPAYFPRLFTQLVDKSVPPGVCLLIPRTPRLLAKGLPNDERNDGEILSSRTVFLLFGANSTIHQIVRALPCRSRRYDSRIAASVPGLQFEMRRLFQRNPLPKI